MSDGVHIGILLSRVERVGSRATPTRNDQRVVGGCDVDLLEVLVVEGAADLLDDRGAAAGLHVARMRRFG